MECEIGNNYLKRNVSFGRRLQFKKEIMKKIYFVLTLLYILLLSGCSNKQIYNLIQPKYTEKECQKLPKTQYKECLNQKSMPFDEYEKERKEYILAPHSSKQMDNRSGSVKETQS